MHSGGMQSIDAIALQDIGFIDDNKSLCGLGQRRRLPYSALELWPELAQ